MSPRAADALGSHVLKVRGTGVDELTLCSEARNQQRLAATFVWHLLGSICETQELVHDALTKECELVVAKDGAAAPVAT